MKQETLTYRYDANGNAEQASGRDVEWTSYNKPSRIVKGNSLFEFAYGTDRTRAIPAP